MITKIKKVLFPLVNHNKEYFNDDGQLVQSGGSTSDVIGWIVHILLIAGAAYLCWTCNKNESTVRKIVYTLLAAIFAWIYLIYYVIAHILMKKPCDGDATNVVPSGLQSGPQDGSPPFSSEPPRLRGSEYSFEE